MVNVSNIIWSASSLFFSVSSFASTTLAIWFYCKRIRPKLTYSCGFCHNGSDNPTLKNFVIKNKRDITIPVHSLFCVHDDTVYSLVSWVVPKIIPPYGIFEVEIEKVTAYMDGDNNAITDIFGIDKEHKFYVSIGEKFLCLLEDNSADAYFFASENKLKLGHPYKNIVNGIVITQKRDYLIMAFSEENTVQGIIESSGTINWDSYFSKMEINGYEYGLMSESDLTSVVREEAKLDDGWHVEIVDLKSRLPRSLRN